MLASLAHGERFEPHRLPNLAYSAKFDLSIGSSVLGQNNSLISTSCVEPY